MHIRQGILQNKNKNKQNKQNNKQPDSSLWKFTFQEDDKTIGVDGI